MSKPEFDQRILDRESARALELQAAKVFQPRTPISAREFFAGRWNQITTLADAIGQIGLHVVIYGERGVGKTSLANVVKPLLQMLDQELEEEENYSEPGTGSGRIVIKANANTGDTFSSIWQKLFEDLTWRDGKPGIGLVPMKKGNVSIRKAFGLEGDITVDDARRIIMRIPGSVFIVDEYDRAAKETAREFTDLMKALSDFSAECTVILVGVSDTIDQLVADHASINRALIQILLPRMEFGELREILTKAEKSLEIQFSEDAGNLIVNISQGLPHYTHLLGLHSVRMAAKRMSAEIEQRDVFDALKEAVKQAQQTVTDTHSKAIHSAHKDALFRQVLIACALTAAQAHDALGYFNPGAIADPLKNVLGRDVEIATFSNHLSEFCQEKRARVLERTGQARAYRFRFRDPLLVPFVFLDAVATGVLEKKQLAALLGSGF